MSHFTVMVCLSPDDAASGIEAALDAIMAPYDENLRVTPYRSYQEGPPEDFWFVRMVREGAEHHRAGTVDEGVQSRVAGLRSLRDHRSRDSVETERLVDEMVGRAREDCAKAARLEPLLAQHPGWRGVVLVYNAYFGHGSELAGAADDSDSETLYYEPETDRAYTVSTYNQKSKWDYWRVGGRWGGSLIAKRDDPRLIYGGQHWDSPPVESGAVVPLSTATMTATTCDGGPIYLLDFEAMRDRDGRAAASRYDRWIEMVHRYGPIEHGFADLRESCASIDEVRERYRAQPIVAAHDALPPEERLIGFFGLLEQEFAGSREDYIQRHRDAAVPAYATVTLDGTWQAPGEMGWWGFSSDDADQRAIYHRKANDYINGLDSDVVLVMLDCHI